MARHQHSNARPPRRWLRWRARASSAILLPGATPPVHGHQAPVRLESRVVVAIVRVARQSEAYNGGARVCQVCIALPGALHSPVSGAGELASTQPVGVARGSASHSETDVSTCRDAWRGEHRRLVRAGLHPLRQRQGLRPGRPAAGPASSQRSSTSLAATDSRRASAALPGAYQGPSTTTSAGGAAASPSARRPSYRVSPMRRRRAAEASPKPPTAREAAARACLLRRPGAPRERAAPRPDRGAHDASRRGPRPRGLPAPPPHAFHHRGAHVVSRATSAARSSSPRTRASRNGPRCSAATRSSQPERAFLDRLLHHSHVIGALGEGYPPA